MIQANSAALAHSVGADELQNGDERPMVKALVDDLNARGGLHGRRVTPVYFEFDPQQDSNRAVIQQKACAFFTEDNKVVAALFGWHVFTDHALESCLQRRGVIPVNSAGILTGDNALLRRLPDLVAPPGVTLERQAKGYAEAIVRQGFINQKNKVGVIVLDAPDYRTALEGSLVPALRRHGITELEKAYLPPLQTSDDLSQQTTSMSTAVLRFNQLHIDRVLFLQPGVNGPFLFMQTAESQDYHPRYAVSTADGPTGLVTLAPKTQLEGTVGIGWIPVDDVPADKESIPAPGSKRCLDLMRRTGQTLTTRSVEYVALSFCDSLWFFEHAASRARAVDRLAIRSAVSLIGSTYQSPLVFKAQFSSTQRDGAAAFRDFGYNGSCNCFTYHGPLRVFS